MKIEELQQFLDTQTDSGIKIPEDPEGSSYTRYFVRASNISWSWTVLADAERLYDLLSEMNDNEFDDDDVDAILEVRSIGLTAKQVEIFHVHFSEEEE